MWVTTATRQAWRVRTARPHMLSTTVTAPFPMPMVFLAKHRPSPHSNQVVCEAKKHKPTAMDPQQHRNNSYRVIFTPTIVFTLPSQRNLRITSKNTFILNSNHIKFNNHNSNSIQT
jgi:hypothetical protein